NHVTGWPDREPFGSLPYTDYIVAPLGALAAIAALEYRRRTGRGQFLDLSQVEAALLFLAPAILDYTANGRDFERRGNFSAERAPPGVYRPAAPDGWLAIAAQDDRAWSALAQVLGLPADDRHADLPARLADAGALDRLVEAWTVRRSGRAAMAALQAAG